MNCETNTAKHDKRGSLDPKQLRHNTYRHRVCQIRSATSVSNQRIACANIENKISPSICHRPFNTSIHINMYHLVLSLAEASNDQRPQKLGYMYHMGVLYVHVLYGCILCIIYICIFLKRKRRMTIAAATDDIHRGNSITMMTLRWRFTHIKAPSTIDPCTRSSSGAAVSHSDTMDP